MATTPLQPRKYEDLFTVQSWATHTWHYAIGHPKSGQVSRKELFHNLALDVAYIVDTATGRIRKG